MWKYVSRNKSSTRIFAIALQPIYELAVIHTGNGGNATWIWSACSIDQISIERLYSLSDKTSHLRPHEVSKRRDYVLPWLYRSNISQQCFWVACQVSGGWMITNLCIAIWKHHKTLRQHICVLIVNIPWFHSINYEHVLWGKTNKTYCCNW